MFRCKDVAKSLAKVNFKDLNNKQRFFMLVHIVICPVCGGFHRDVVKSHKNARAFCEQDELVEAELPNDTKQRMQDEINKLKQ